MRVAAVSLEDSFLRVAIAEKRFGVIKPVTSEDIRLPLSEQERASVIKETIQRVKEKHRANRLVFGLNFNSFSHAILEMPLLSKADMKNALLYELEKYLPLPPQEYIYDFSITEKTKNKAKIIALSIQNEKMNGLLSIVKGSGLGFAGIRCSFIEGVNEFISVTKIKDAIFIYIAEDAYYIAALKEQMPVLFKIVLKGKDIVSEIERLTETFDSSIFVSGISEPALLDKINARTFPLSLSNAVALSVLRKPKIELNFMPAELLPRRKDYYPHALGAVTALSVVIFFFTALFSYYKDYSALKDIENKTEKIKAEASGFLETRKKIELLYERQKFLYEFQGQRNLNIRVLAELSRIVPKDAWLTNMSADEKGKVEIEGFAKRAASIIEPLSKSKILTKVEFISPIVSQNNQEKFSIRMLVQPDSKGDAK